MIFHPTIYFKWTHPLQYELSLWGPAHSCVWISSGITFVCIGWLRLFHLIHLLMCLSLYLHFVSFLSFSFCFIVPHYGLLEYFSKSPFDLSLLFVDVSLCIDFNDLNMTLCIHNVYSLPVPPLINFTKM